MKDNLPPQYQIEAEVEQTVSLMLNPFLGLNVVYAFLTSDHANVIVAIVTLILSVIKLYINAVKRLQI